MKLLICLPLLFVGWWPAHAQENPATVLTNEEIVALVKAGQTPEQIVARIQSASTPCKFDTSTDAIAKLDAAGVPLSVTISMGNARCEERGTKTRAAPAAGLTNGDILDLLKAGLSAEIVAAKIKASSGAYDTSPAALKQLKESGVPDAVILAMVEAAMPAAAAVPPTHTATPAPVTPRYSDNSTPEYGDLSEIAGKYLVHVTADDMNSRELIVRALRGQVALTVVDNPDDAEFFLAYETKASTESLGRRRTHYLRSQLVAYRHTETGRKRMLWSENETYEESGGISFSRPNEVNLAKNFVKALQKVRGVKK